jgi:hypothetical protein
MILQVASPGVQYGDHSYLSAEKPWVTGEFFKGLRRSAKQDGVDDLLMRAGNGSQFVRQSEGHHEVGDGKQQIALLLKPFAGLIVLTFWAMAVLAGVERVAVLAADVAEIDLTAEARGAAGFNCFHGSQMRGGHSVGVVGSILRAVQPEYVGYFGHQGHPVMRDQ